MRLRQFIKKCTVGITTLAILATSITITDTGVKISAATVSEETNIVEQIGRGISAVNTGSGMLVTWRYLANDSDNTVFNLYRNDTLIYTSNIGEATCFLDANGKATDKYVVESKVNGVSIDKEECELISNNDYFQINLTPPTATNCTYSPNDCSVGDADGDGEYEIFLKWDPSNSQDNSKSGVTGNVYIDCIKLDGTRLWRIDLGPNIRAGAHYTQFLVADFDCDGYAEMTCKTSDGTVDGKGNVIGDASKKYANSNGYILTGNEFYTLFDGRTGEALDTVNYNPVRGTVSAWGDKYGNRVDRFLGTVAYLDGVHPSAVTMRGYYTRMTACAYDVVDKKLVERWLFDTGFSSSVLGYGDGNHNCMPADVDGDGKQEIITGNTCIDDDGKLKWCLNMGHGDAMHVGDFLPAREGLEVWICHEDSPYGVTLIDASKGTKIFHVDGEKDTGRCCADNVWSGNSGAEFWGLGNNVYDGNGNLLSCKRPAINFLCYWDGDLEREILDGYTDTAATISKMNANGTILTLKSTDGYYTCNTTKGTPCLSADIFGDWREEVIVRASDSKSIRIYCTTYVTDYRITTLMHDPQYRNQVSAQQTAYNQPPHASFYLGSDASLPSRPNVTVRGEDGTSEHVHNYPNEYTVDVEPTETTDGEKSIHCTGKGCDSRINVTVLPAYNSVKKYSVTVNFNEMQATNSQLVTTEYFGSGIIKTVGSNLVYKTAKDSDGNYTQNVTGIQVDKTGSVGFSVMVYGKATLSVTASSNSSTNTSKVNVIDKNGLAIEEKTGLTSVTGGSADKKIFVYELSSGEYTVVCPTDSPNVLRINSISATGNLVQYIDVPIEEDKSELDEEVTSQKKSGLCKSDDGSWYYYNENNVATEKNGIVENDAGKWYVENGKLDFNKTGVVEDNGVEYVVKYGYMSTGYYGLTKKSDGTWAYAEAGVLTYAYTGLAKNDVGWWYVTDGVIDFSYTGIAANATGSYRVVNGQIDFSYNGWFDSDGEWYYMRGGMVDTTKIGLQSLNGDYYYLTAGQINFNYTGLAENAGNTYYVKYGRLDFGFSGNVTVDGKDYTVKNGIVQN